MVFTESQPKVPKRDNTDTSQFEFPTMFPNNDHKKLYSGYYEQSPEIYSPLDRVTITFSSNPIPSH